MKRIASGFASLLQDRPLCLIAAVFMLCTASVLLAPLFVKILLFFVGLSLAVFLLVLRKRTIRYTLLFLRIAVCLLVICAACLTSFLSSEVTTGRALRRAQKEEAVPVTVYLEEPIYDYPYGSLYKATVERIDGKRVFGVTTLLSFERGGLPLYVRMTGETAFSRIEKTSEYSDYSGMYLGEGTLTQADGSLLTVTDDHVRTPSYFAYTVRKAIGERLGELMSEEASGLTEALLTGNRSRLKEELRRDFKTLGVSHLLAISGMHLSILFMLLEALLMRLRIPFPARTVILVFSVVIYMTICGFSPSVTRAGIMLLLLLIARLFGRTADPFTSLFLSGMLMIAVSPYTVFNVAFLLSFFSVFGVLLSGRFLRRVPEGKRRVPYRILSLFLTSLFAQTAILPVVFFSFGRISFGAPVFSLLISPFVYVVLLLAPIFLALSFIPYIGPLLMAFLSAFCNLTVRVSSLAGYVKALCVPISAPAFALFSAAALIFLLLFYSKRKKRWAAGALASYLLFFGACFLIPRLAPPRAISETYRKNDVLFAVSGGRRVLIDLSDGSTSCLRESLAFLDDQTGFDGPTDLLLTHYHRKHAVVFERLCRTAYPERLLLPVPSDEDERLFYGQLTGLAKRYGVEVTTFEPGVGVRIVPGITLTYGARFKRTASSHPSFFFTLSSEKTDVVFFSVSPPPEARTVFCRRAYFCVHGPNVKNLPAIGHAETAVLRDLSLADFEGEYFDKSVLIDGAYVIEF